MDPLASTLLTGKWLSREGSPYPLGVSYVESDDSYNFAVDSKHASCATLLLFGGQDPARPIARIRFDFLRNKSGSIWHCRVPAVQVNGARFYAYQFDGPPPGAQFEFHCFDAEKLLVDPYAHMIYFPSGFNRDAA